MNYFDNPGGMIPPWLVNWAAKVSWPLRLLCCSFELHLEAVTGLNEELQMCHMQRIS